MQYNSVNDPVTHGQACEDSNDAAGDGCSPDCLIESGWECSGYCKLHYFELFIKFNYIL